MRTRSRTRLATVDVAIIDLLSDDLLSEVVAACTAPRDLAACMLVQRSWRRVASGDSCWEQHARARYGTWRLERPLRAFFADRQVAERAAVLLGAMEYVGFYDERFENEWYSMAFWLRAWPALSDGATSPSLRLQGSIHYCFLTAPDELSLWNFDFVEALPAGSVLGLYGGEDFNGHWCWQTQTMECAAHRLVAGNIASQQTLADLLVLTPQLNLSLHGEQLAASPTFQSGAMESRGIADNTNAANTWLEGPCHVKMQGVLRNGAEPAALLRGLRPDANLTHLPPGESWRPSTWSYCRRAKNGRPLKSFAGFDRWPRPPCASHLQAAMQRKAAALL